MPDHKSYRASVDAPWGKLLYLQLWGQLPAAKTILDFGSGFGLTAAHLSQHANVVAIEPDVGMLALRETGDFEQRIGGIETLRPDEEYDLILCHNVLEYVPNRHELLLALCEHVKPGGCLSIVKHHPPGKVMAAAVFEQNPQKALELLQGTPATSANFGIIDEYHETALLQWLDGKMKLEQVLGLRCGFGLVQNNQIKSDEAWRDAMLLWENAVCGLEPYRSVAFFHHLLFHRA